MGSLCIFNRTLDGFSWTIVTWVNIRYLLFKCNRFCYTLNSRNIKIFWTFNLLFRFLRYFWNCWFIRWWRHTRLFKWKSLISYFRYYDFNRYSPFIYLPVKNTNYKVVILKRLTFFLCLFSSFIYAKLIYP